VSEHGEDPRLGVEEIIENNTPNMATTKDSLDRE